MEMPKCMTFAEGTSRLHASIAALPQLLSSKVCVVIHVWLYDCGCWFAPRRPVHVNDDSPKVYQKAIMTLTPFVHKYCPEDWHDQDLPTRSSFSLAADLLPALLSCTYSTLPIQQERAATYTCLLLPLFFRCPLCHTHLLE